MATWVVRRELKILATQEVEAETEADAVMEADNNLRFWTESDEEILTETVERIGD